jgi:hypothetical protein
MRSLVALFKMRKAAVIEARFAFARALATEEGAAEAEHRSAIAIRSEIEAASAEEGDDTAVEALVSWLPLARMRQRAAQKRKREAEAATARARATLAVAKAAEAAVASAIRTEGAIAAKRRDEVELNDLPSTRRARRDD